MMNGLLHDSLNLVIRRILFLFDINLQIVFRYTLMSTRTLKIYSVYSAKVRFMASRAVWKFISGKRVQNNKIRENYEIMQ